MDTGSLKVDQDLPPPSGGGTNFPDKYNAVPNIY